MSRRSPLPDSSGRYHDSDEGDRYRSGRGDPDGYRSSADGESRRDDRRDRRAPERDTRRDYRDDRRRRDDDDDGRRKKDDFYGRDGGRRRRDGSRDNRYASRHDNDNDRDRSRREDYRDRGDHLRDDRDHRERDGERGGSSRRSASPRRSRPRSRSTSAPPEDKAKPNFAPSGLLAAATNTVKNVDGTSTLLKYNEPPEARKPLVGWRLYVFKGDEQVDLLHIHRQSAYLIGRDRTVADIPLEHPSCSKQHAVIQYRLVQQKDEFGNSKGVIKPFVIDLESTNGTHVNGEAIPTSRYYELKASDVLKFGTSNREYVLLHDEVS
ncbi:SMAD/FHA domain-containing protein [Lactifluus subvellereus]|nr:SMAD/FHA domain-containing protein [Lactifluus subvellereus]